MNIDYRTIGNKDNEILSTLIKKVFEEFGIDIPGTVYTDPTTDALYELFQAPGSVYWIAEENNQILGGCGIFPTEGLPEGYAELVKLYLSAEYRGRGIGHTLMQKSLESAKVYSGSATGGRRKSLSRTPTNKFSQPEQGNIAL